MADWAAIYERAEDRWLRKLEKLVEEREAERIIKDSLQGTTGTTTMSQEEKPHD